MVIIKYAIEDAVGVTRCLSVGSSSGICVSKSAGFATASVARGVRRYGPTGDIRDASGRQLRRPFGLCGFVVSRPEAWPVVIRHQTPERAGWNMPEPSVAGPRRLISRRIDLFR